MLGSIIITMTNLRYTRDSWMWIELNIVFIISASQSFSPYLINSIKSENSHQVDRNNMIILSIMRRSGILRIVHWIKLIPNQWSKPFKSRASIKSSKQVNNKDIKHKRLRMGLNKELSRIFHHIYCAISQHRTKHRLFRLLEYL